MLSANRAGDLLIATALSMFKWYIIFIIIGAIIVGYKLYEHTGRSNIELRNSLESHFTTEFIGSSEYEADKKTYYRFNCRNHGGEQEGWYGCTVGENKSFTEYMLDRYDIVWN